MNKSVYIFLLTALLLISTKNFGQISGRCIDSQTGEPVENARFTRNGDKLTSTGQSGHFSFPGDSAVIVSVLHPDYKTMKEEVAPNRKNLFLLTPSDQQIDEVTVSAPMLNYQSRKVPAGFSIVPADTLHPLLQGVEVIEQSPGVVMQKGAINTGRITIRGIGSRSPYATTRVRAYLDDIPLTSGDGHTTIEDLEMYNIARAEIVRGPSSALYGSGMGGVIVFHPDHAQSAPLSIEALAQYGSFDQTKALINAGIRRNKTIIKTTLSRTKNSGYRENNNYERWNGQLMIRHHFGNHSLFFLANHIDLHAGIPSSLDRETYINSPGKAAANWLAIEGFEQYKKWLSGITLKSDFSNTFNNKLSVYLNHINAYEPRPFNILDDRMLTYGLRDEITWKNSLFELTGGAELFSEQYDWQLSEIIEGDEGDLFADNHETRQYVNIFGKVDIIPFTGWNISAGANVHFLKFKLEDYFEDEQDVSNQYRYDPVVSPRIGITGDLRNNLTLFASAGHGFSPPSVEETLLPEGNINPGIQPEEGLNFDAGLRGNFPNQDINFDITAYHVALENLLVTKRETEEIFYGINAGKTSHYGLESQVKANIVNNPSNFRLDFNLTHTWMHNAFRKFTDDGNDYSGNQLPGIPNQHTRSALLVSAKKNLHFRLEWNHSGSMYLNDENTKQYGGHHLFNVKASRVIKPGNKNILQLQAGVNNILDQHHASMVLPNAPSFGDNPPRYYYPGAPRNAYFRLILKFTK